MDGRKGERGNVKKKDSVSITTRIGKELFDTLERFCAATGQSKTVAVERAIRMYCGNADKTGDDGDG